MKKWVKLICLSIFLLIVDILSKYLVHAHIPKMSWLYPFYPYGGIGIIKDFLGMSISINYVANFGAAWGVFANYSIYLFYLRILIVVALIAYLIFINPPIKKAMAFCLIITGAIGNILDRIFYGHVVDMIHIKFGSYSYPVFNFADIMITIGIFWLIISSIFSIKKKGVE